MVSIDKNAYATLGIKIVNIIEFLNAAIVFEVNWFFFSNLYVHYEWNNEFFIEIFCKSFVDLSKSKSIFRINWKTNENLGNQIFSYVMKEIQMDQNDFYFLNKLLTRCILWLWFGRVSQILLFLFNISDFFIMALLI